MAKKDGAKEYGNSKLVMDNGQTIDLLISDDIADAVWEEIRDDMKHGDIWWCGNYSSDDVKATFNGITLGEVNMSRVIGIA